MPTRLGERPVTTAADKEALAGLLAALNLGRSGEFVAITIPGTPWSKSRPRFDRRSGRIYHDQKDVDAEQKTAIYLKASFRSPYTSNIALACLFFRPTRGRVDTDNLLKHVCDAANGVIWIDDQQCTGLTGVLDLDRAEPRTVVGFAPHHSGLVRDLSPQPTNPKGGLQLWD